MASHVNTELIKDFIAYKLRQNNIFLEGFTVNVPTKTSKCLRIVADKLIKDNSELFYSMCDQLHLTLISTYPTFVQIADQIFQSGKNWGRIVSFVAFGATLAVHCAQREDLHELVNKVVDWVSLYMNQNLSFWIQENGGWEGFVDFVNFSGQRKKLQKMSVVFGLGVGVGVVTALLLST